MISYHHDLNDLQRTSAFQAWDARLIRDQHWTRIAVLPCSRDHGHMVLLRFFRWFDDQCSGHVMYDVGSCHDFIALAFSERVEAALFRLFFADVTNHVIAQPSAMACGIS